MVATTMIDTTTMETTIQEDVMVDSDDEINSVISMLNGASSVAVQASSLGVIPGGSSSVIGQGDASGLRDENGYLFASGRVLRLMDLDDNETTEDDKDDRDEDTYGDDDSTEERASVATELVSDMSTISSLLTGDSSSSASTSSSDYESDSSDSSASGMMRTQAGVLVTSEMLRFMSHGASNVRRVGPTKPGALETTGGGGWGEEGEEGEEGEGRGGSVGYDDEEETVKAGCGGKGKRRRR
jgi:hypothetical protein